MKKMSFLLMLMITSLVFSQNLFTNGDFANGATGWTLDGGGSVVSGEAYFPTTNAAGNPWDTQLAQNGISFTAGATYTLTFKARAAANRNITVAIQNVGSWDNQTANQVYALTTAMQTFTQTFNAATTGSNVNVAFLLGVQGSTDAVYIDDVVLTGSVPPPPVITPPSAPAQTPPGRLASDVVSVFSNAYTNSQPDTNSAPWDDANVSNVQISGNDTWKVDLGSNGAFWGLELFSGSAIDLTGFTHFHVDIYVSGTVNPGSVWLPKLVNWNNTTNSAANEVEYTYAFAPTDGGKWISIDVPLSSFNIVSGGSNSLNNLRQIVFGTSATLAGKSVYVDNLYFHKNTLAVSESNAKQAAKVYPNPVSAGEMVTVDANVKSLEIYTVSGQKVKSANAKTINTAGLTKGVYLLKATDDKGESQTSKLIVK